LTVAHSIVIAVFNGQTIC